MFKLNDNTRDDS